MLDDDDDDDDFQLTVRPVPPRACGLSGIQRLAAEAADQARTEAQEQDPHAPAAAAPAPRTFTLDPPPRGWSWASQPQKLRLNADGATTADKALTKVLKELQSGEGVQDDDAASTGEEWVLSKSAIMLWDGDDIKPYFQCLLDSRIAHIAVDIEHRVQPSAARPRPHNLGGGKVATLQFAHSVPIMGKFVHVIWLPAYENSNALPDELRELLEEVLDCKHIIGHNVKGDITRVSTDFGLTPDTSDSLSDTMADAKSMFGPRIVWNPRSQWGLADLCLRLLGKRIPKDATLTDWELPLSDDQICYAGADALAALIIYHTLRFLQDLQCGLTQVCNWQARVEGRERKQQQRQHLGGIVNDGTDAGILVGKGSAALVKNLGSQDAAAGNLQWLRFPSGHLLESLLRCSTTEASAVWWFQADFLAVETPSLLRWCKSELLFAGLPEVDPVDQHLTTGDAPFMRSVCVIHGLRWFESNRSLFEAGRQQYAAALQNLTESEGDEEDEDDDQAQERRAKRKSKRRKLNKARSTAQREMEVKMKADVQVFKNQPFGEKEKMLAKLMLRKWKNVYKERVVAEAWAASWVVPNTYLCRASLNPTGGLANDNQGLEAENYVQKADFDFKRYTPTTFCANFPDWLSNKSSEDNSFAAYMDYTNKVLDSWNTAFFQEAVEQYYALAQGQGFLSAKFFRRLADDVQVIDIPSRKVVSYLTEELPAHQRVKKNDATALKLALLHTHPCNGRNCNGCSDSWYKTYEALHSSGDALPPGLHLDFDLYMDFATSFHTLTPMLDHVRVHALVRRLTASNMQLDLTKLGSVVGQEVTLNDSVMKKSGFVTCNCGPFLHTNWCIHMCLDAMVKGLIKKLPSNFRAELITSWRTGRIANASAGGARGVS